MSRAPETSDIVAVPDDAHQSLLSDGSDAQTRASPVVYLPSQEKTRDLEQPHALDELVQIRQPKENTQFVGLTKEELKVYINDPKWKRIRWIIALLYILLLALLLAGAIYLVVTSPRCPPKPKRDWYQTNIIYEIDVTNFRDSNGDGIGDLKGVEEKVPYLEKNLVKSILLQSSIFNATGGTSLQLDGGIPHDKNIDLLTIDPSVGTDKDFQDLARVLYRKDMALIIDLPLASTPDPNGQSWYGSTALGSPIVNPCVVNSGDLGCRFYELYGRLPLDFANENIYEESKSRIEHWLSTKKVDGIRVNLPLKYDSSTRSYNISYETVQRWNNLKNDIAKKSKPKLLLYDIPFGFQRFIDDDRVHNTTTHALYLLDNQQRSNINASQLGQRLQSFEQKRLAKPAFWQLGSKRKSDDIGAIPDRQLPREMVLTLAMLLGGTPVVLYGEEIALDQKSYPLMAWTPDEVSRGFSNCKTPECKGRFMAAGSDPSRTSVKRQEALGGKGRDSLLTVFRQLAKLRRAESFQYGSFESGCDRQSNLFWFIREAPGHRGYITLFNLNKNPKDLAHVSLPELTNDEVPLHVHYEYQWPTSSLASLNQSYINSDNLLIQPRSINIFSWAAKMVKPNVLAKRVEQRRDTC